MRKILTLSMVAGAALAVAACGGGNKAANNTAVDNTAADTTYSGNDMMDTVLDGLDGKANDRLLRDLALMKDNLRAAIGRNSTEQQSVKAS